MTSQDQQRIFDKAARQFNSNIKALDEDVLRLEKWLKTQPHLPNLLGTLLNYSVKNFTPNFRSKLSAKFFNPQQMQHRNREAESR